ncbi:hypothetical protein EHQ53_03795 [Leptospira langatensis]|uniref:Uncharacterized protein n=1 Tax=Leptospira langatensis TaxID=2484983 RepID=A0A5F1ZY15_9LEPT|nr:hypothetical protein [Leptospira langatensis]TGK04282.1 hypothetical protein EHO57_04025 [Leptospira langatensis]TGL43762.1 hypothetical protein EHQ53_03795 [Leptospira langatensis]
MESPSFSFKRILALLLLLILNVPLFSQEQTIPELPVLDPVKPQKQDRPKPRIFRYNRLTIQEDPYKAPSSIPRDFVPPQNSTLLFSTELKSDRLLENKESIVVFKSTFSKQVLETYYEILIFNLNHKILQNQKTDAKSLYLVEVFGRKTVAISIVPNENGSLVKLFHRTSGGF